jgi:peroxiredoxin
LSRAGPWLLAIAVAAAAAFAVATAPRTPPPLSRGGIAPAFQLASLDGDQVTLESLQGRVVLVNFWATWCKPCEDEMPAMGRLYDALKNQGFDLLAVSVDEGTEEVRQFQDRLELPFPLLLDPDQAVAERYQTYRFPESFLVDREGVIVERYIGPKDWDSPAYLERVRALLAEG